jgi:hypothetical protein
MGWRNRRRAISE